MARRSPFLIEPLSSGPGARQATQGNSGDSVKTAAQLVSATIILAALYYGRDVLLPLALAFLLSFTLNPAVLWLRMIGAPRLVAVITVVTIVVCMIGGFTLVLGEQVRLLSSELPSYQNTIREKVSALRETFQAPGMFDGALETMAMFQNEVGETTVAEIPGVQRVQVVPTSASALERAVAWLGRAIEPLATTGIVLVFVFLALLERLDIRDRFLRILGGNLHRTTDAMNEAGTRISRYLLMQLVVNVSYGVPMAIGLWFIGVPGAFLWGTVAALMRFIPYVGPMISAIFPLTLAFAVDPGWHMLLWALSLIILLELVSNNIVEPLLYGSSTGLSAMSLIAAATFWTALWGPIGLILSTPLTVCLLVIGKHLPQLKFLEVLLGSAPALDLPTRIYQRLIADDVEEVIEISTAQIEATSPTEYYNSVGIPMLRLASQDRDGTAKAEHRLRIASGVETLLDDLQSEYPPAVSGDPSVVCIGGKWEVDTSAAVMLTHALQLEDIPAESRMAASVNADYMARLDIGNARIVCLSYFSTDPVMPARHFCRRLRMKWPNIEIVVALWNAPEHALTEDSIATIGADHVVTSINEAVQRLRQMIVPASDLAYVEAEIPDNDAERVKALHATGALDGHAAAEFDAVAKRATDVFDTNFAMVSLIDADKEIVVGKSGTLPKSLTNDSGELLTMSRNRSICGHVVADGELLVIPDIERDPRFADNPALDLRGSRFYAGAPLRTKDGFILGTLCILDPEPRTMSDSEIDVLNAMASDVMMIITGDGGAETPERKATSQSNDPSAMTGQRVPE